MARSTSAPRTTSCGASALPPRSTQALSGLPSSGTSSSRVRSPWRNNMPPRGPLPSPSAAASPAPAGAFPPSSR
ncbi:Uncharacterised protein [Acinetobacter baumannii]|nr:Uncharacterised protein [Acinetobacter baumannii]